MTYFPSIVWPRKISLEKNMANARAKNSELKYQIRLGNTDIQLFTKDNNNPMWTRTDLDQYGPIEDLPEVPNSNNTYTTNSNKRKDITPIKADAKKQKEQHEASDKEDNEKKGFSNCHQHNKLEVPSPGPSADDIATNGSATMDTDSELSAKVFIKNNV